MTELSFNFKRTVYFVNEGESTYRYKIFHIDRDGREAQYDLSGFSQCAEQIRIGN